MQSFKERFANLLAERKAGRAAATPSVVVAIPAPVAPRQGAVLSAAEPVDPNATAPPLSPLMSSSSTATPPAERERTGTRSNGGGCGCGRNRS